MPDNQFYFNPSTGEVTQGKQTAWTDRMGPYATREDAQAALERARQRTKQADAADEADDDWGEPASWEK